MIWLRGTPYHRGGLYDLTLRDLLDLDRLLAQYQGLLSHWWEIPAAQDDLLSMSPERRHLHPEAPLLVAVMAWGTLRANGRPDSLDEVLDSGLGWRDVEVTDEDSEAEESLPRGFRASNTQSSSPELDGMDLRREVYSRLLDVMALFRLTPDDVWRLPLAVWLGVAAQIDSLDRR